MRRLLPQERANIVGLYVNDSLTMRSIAKRYGRSAMCICYLLHRECPEAFAPVPTSAEVRGT
jgi:transposase